MQTYTLTEDERGMLEGIDAQVRALQAEAQSVLQAIMRYRGLQGAYTLTDGVLTRNE